MRSAEIEASDEPWIEPTPASVLASLEHERRERVGKEGRCGVGCKEVDEVVLPGGLERGVVAGVSSEGQFGLLVRYPVGSFLRWVAYSYPACCGWFPGVGVGIAHSSDG